MPSVDTFRHRRGVGADRDHEQADSKSHQMNERPCSHSSKVVMSIMPSATLNKMRPINRPSVTETAGEEVIRQCRMDRQRAEGRGWPL